jgi:hypothetical protein
MHMAKPGHASRLAEPAIGVCMLHRDISNIGLVLALFVVSPELCSHDGWLMGQHQSLATKRSSRHSSPVPATAIGHREWHLRGQKKVTTRATQGLAGLRAFSRTAMTRLV